MGGGRSAWRPILVVVGLTLAQKLLLLLLPMHGVLPWWVVPEEQTRGNIALEILAGPLLSLQDYHHAPNVGGSLVVGILFLPLMLLLGKSLFVLRLVPLLFNAVAVAAMFAILDRHVSRRAAWIGALLLGLAPPAYALISITALGTHLENNALTLVCLYLFLRSHDPAGRPVRWLAAAGLVAGFATYFGYFFVVALGVMLGLELVYDRRFVLSRRFGAFVAGYAVGLIPWLAYNLSRDFAGLFIYHEQVGVRVGLVGLIGSLGRQVVGLVTELPGAFFFRNFPRPFDRIAGWAFYLVLLVFLVLALAALRRSFSGIWRAPARRPVEARSAPVALYGLLYPIAFLAAATAMHVTLDHLAWSDAPTAHDTRYATPLYPFLVLAAAAGAERLASLGRGARRLTVGLTAVLLTLNVLGTASFCDPANAGETLRTPGTSRLQLGVFLSWRYRTDSDRMSRVAEGLESRPPEEQREVLWIIGLALRESVLAKNTPLDALGRPVTRERYREMLALMRSKVDPRFAMYFEDPQPGDPSYQPPDRERFEADWRLRHPAGEAAGEGG